MGKELTEQLGGQPRAIASKGSSVIVVKGTEQMDEGCNDGAKQKVRVQ